MSRILRTRFYPYDRGDSPNWMWGPPRWLPRHRDPIDPLQEQMLARLRRDLARERARKNEAQMRADQDYMAEHGLDALVNLQNPWAGYDDE